ncbi:MAG: hypothetical protein M1435_03190 [Actinobacteria bacterium]|nr:hypothetical protein [Actinomycetota bacterium]
MTTVSAAARTFVNAARASTGADQAGQWTGQEVLGPGREEGEKRKRWVPGLKVTAPFSPSLR